MYSVYIKDGKKAVIALERDNGVYVASQFYSSVSEKSRGRFDEEEYLVREGFGIYRAYESKFENDYRSEAVFDTLSSAVKYCKMINGESVECSKKCSYETFLVIGAVKTK